MSQGETNKNKIEKTADSSSSSRKKKARCSSNPDNGVHQLDKNMEPKESSKNEPRSVAKTIEYYMTKLRSHANRGPEETDEKNLSSFGCFGDDMLSEIEMITAHLVKSLIVSIILSVVSFYLIAYISKSGVYRFFSNLSNYQQHAQFESTKIIYYKSVKYPGLRKERFETQEYREDPSKTSENDPELTDNILFFENKIPSRPYGDYLDSILKNWWGDYDRLESHHGFIQWLFPLRKAGLNSKAHPLQLHELEYLRKKPATKESLLKSYQMMLDFYGMRLRSVKTGEIERADNYKERYKNLRSNRHNFLRITRILQCLGDFELNTYQVEFLRFLIKETFEEKKLSELDSSLANFWVHSVKNDRIRGELIERIEYLASQ